MSVADQVRVGVFGAAAVCSGAPTAAVFEDYIYGDGSDATKIERFAPDRYDCKLGFQIEPKVSARSSEALQVTIDAVGQLADPPTNFDADLLPSVPELDFLAACVDGLADQIPLDLLEPGGLISLGTCSSFMPASIVRMRARDIDQETPLEVFAAAHPTLPGFFVQARLGHPIQPKQIGFCNTACSSSLEAFFRAVMAVRSGRVAWAIGGGVDVVNELLHSGFDMSKVLTNEPSRPFDHRRSGFQIGEGAAILLVAPVDSLPHEYLLCEVAGFGVALDGHHLTAPDPNGGGLARAVTAALCDRPISAVGGIVAHGTGTPRNDPAEAEAVHSLCAEGSRPIPIASLKSRMGHTLGAAGAHNLVAAVTALRRKELFGTRNLENAIVPPTLKASGAAEPLVEPSVLVNAAAFGGHNASCLLLTPDS